MIQKNWKNLLKNLCNFFFLSLSLSAFSYTGKKHHLAHKPPSSLEGIGVKEHLGESIDLNLSFLNSQGEFVQLKNYFKDKPVLMTVIYYNCPNLCNFHLNGIFEAITQMKNKAGKDYEFVIVSMDSTETPKQARSFKNSYYKEYNFKDEASFLVGEESTVQKLTKQLGFSFRWDDETSQFAHIPVAYVLDSLGKITRYLYGVQFKPKTIKLSLVEAARGKVGNVVDRILLFCYRFNPNKNQYTIYAYNIMRAGAAMSLLLLISFLLPIWLREKKK